MDSWSPDVPPAEDCVLGPVLRQHVLERPDAVFAVFSDGTQWTYRDVWAAANTTARELQELGVGHGDRVLSWLPNGPDAIRVWFGANLLGAIYVPLNTAYRGGLLEHAVRLSGASVLLASPGLIERLEGLDVDGLRHVIAVAPIRELDHDQEPVTPDRTVQPWDPHAIILTSGTTGPSKGVVCSYLHVATSAAVVVGNSFGPDDRYMMDLPLFHVAGTLCTYAALLYGGSITVVDNFDTASWWDTIRATGTTHASLLGSMATFLAKQPPSAEDRNHSLRRVTMGPVIDDVSGFSERFGVEIIAVYNMTEISIPFVSETNPTAPSTCGKLRRGVDARLVDEHDREVPAGEVGELILRTERPWAMNSGYWGMPDATARAWRNGWFHTGDAFRRDADGNYFFVDRMKDAIRRRGENISSFEVEAEILAHPAVLEVAVVAVPSPHGEDDVLAVVAPVDGMDIDPAELLATLVERMPHFMVPRYIRIKRELPKTSTNKIEKYLLRAEGVTADTWDRERAGIQVKRERFAHR